MATIENKINGEGRLIQLDGLRTFAFLCVFVHHSLHVPLLWCGVDLFFVLSGFLITGILLKQRSSENYFKNFYYRRFLRIFPPYYLVLAITFIFLDQSWQDNWYWYVLYLSNFQDAFIGGGIHALSPMWSLAVEEQFYLLWPLLVYFLGRKGMWRFSISLLLIAPLLRFGLTFITKTHFPIYMLLPTRVDLLAWGAVLVMLRYNSAEKFRRLSDYGPYLSALSLILFFIITKMNPGFRTGNNNVLFNTVGYSLIGTMMVGIVAYCAILRDNWFFKILCNRILTYLGTVSYMMYLSHQMVLSQVDKFGLSNPVTALIAFLVTLMVSMLSWHLFEKPILMLKERLKNSKTQDCASICRPDLA
jgi:peptidoglycan/LPS O-acetylase OafA/YrhL